MKRLVFLSIIFVLLALPACSAVEETPPMESDKPVFYLSELPELPPFEIPPQIIKRYGKEDYADTLMPADDYGKLYPYLGEGYTMSGYGRARYGLVDAKGRIVVDPVYSNAYYLYQNEDYLCLVYPLEKNEMIDENMDGAYDIPNRMFVARADGSWVSRELTGDAVHVSEERIIVSSYDQKPFFKLFDFDGRLLLERDGYFEGFSDGLGAVRYYELDSEGKDTSWSQYIDTDGNYINEPVKSRQETGYYDYEQEFHYYRDDATGLEGITDKNGNIVVPAEFEWVMIDIGGGWSMGQYQSPENGIALIKGDIKHRFPYAYGQSVHCYFIRDSLFAINYYGYGEDSKQEFPRVDIFDADTGKIVKCLPDMHYYYGIENGLYLFNMIDRMRVDVLNESFEPHFPEGVFGPGGGLFDFRHVADDVYHVRTAFSSGLIKGNGEWLIRINISNYDF